MCFLACDTGITPVAAGYGGNSFALRRTHTQADTATWTQVLPREVGLGAGSRGGRGGAAHNGCASGGMGLSPTTAHVQSAVGRSSFQGFLIGGVITDFPEMCEYWGDAPLKGTRMFPGQTLTEYFVQSDPEMQTVSSEQPPSWGT